MGFAEVDVEVGHRYALGIEEALEQQVQLDRVEVGDGQRPGDDAAGARSAARPDRDVIGLGPFDEVGDDQEVAGKAHAGDDVDLEIEPFAICGLLILRLALEPQLQARMRLAPQRFVLVIAEAREDRSALGRGDGAALGDDGRVGDRLGQVGEQFLHRLAPA